MPSSRPIPAALQRTGSEVSYRVLDYGFKVRTNIPEVADLVDDLLGHWEVSDVNGAPTYYLSQVQEEPPRFTLYRDDACIQGEARAYSGGMIDFLLSDVTRHVIEDTEGFLVVHASAASWQGQGILLPAMPDSGKTTTVAGLTAAGFTYLTDEAALIDPTSGWMRPYPRPLSMDPNTIRALVGLYGRLPNAYHEILGRQQYHIPAKYLGASGGPEQCPVRYVIAPLYSEGTATELEPVSRAEAVKIVFENCFNFEDHGVRGLDALRLAIKDAHCYRLRIGDLQEAVEAIKKVVGGPRA